MVRALDLALNQTRIEVEGDADVMDPKIKVEVGSLGRKSDASGCGGGTLVEDPDIGWGRWYTLNEVELATRGFAERNVIGEGGYGVVYRGVLQDGSVVAVKNLHNNKYVKIKIFFLILTL